MKNQLLIARIFAIVGVLTLVVAAFLFFTTNSFRKHATLARGTVIDMVSRKERGASLSYAPVITYRDAAGVRHTYISDTFTDPPAYAVGDAVNVFFNRSNPEEARLDGYLAYLGTLILTILGATFCIVSAAALWRARKRQSTYWLPNGRMIPVEHV